MAVTLRRQLSEADKQQILAVHGRTCFATGHPIPTDEPVQFDHIRAWSTHGASELENIAPMCETHNKQKGTLPLDDFRVKLRLQEFFAAGDTLTLKHLLKYLREHKDIPACGEPVVISRHDETVEVESALGKHSYTLYRCPTTGWQYFYATVPIELLDSDDDKGNTSGLQPRYLIPEKVFDLYRHFQQHPVLQPSMGRVSHNHILLFDGQHKIAGLLWTGRRVFECKVYLSPDLRLLNETNIAAHDRFSQTRFYTSVMVEKLGKEFGDEFDRYRNLEDGEPKTESGFMEFLTAQGMNKADRNKRFLSYLYNSIQQSEDNRIARLVSKGNRSTDEKPLTLDMLTKSLFACFLYTEPVSDNMATDSYLRDQEVENVVTLLNMLYDLALTSWNGKVGPNNDNQRRLVRIFRSRSIMAWAELLRDAVCGKLDLEDADDRARPFYRCLSADDSHKVEIIVKRLLSWKLWNSAPNSEIDRVLADNKAAVKAWLRAHGMTTGYLMGAPE